MIAKGLASSGAPLRYDLLVVGSGAAGLAAAAAAATNGQLVLVCERASVFGGTSAMSGGELWIPLSRQAGDAPQDSVDEALEYLQHAVGAELDAERAAAYVRHAGEALAFFEDHAGLQYELLQSVVDYYDLPGAKCGMRSLGAIPFDGRRLGTNFGCLRAPLQVSQFLGGMSVGREDLPHFLSASRSPRSALHVTRLVAGYAFDRMRGYPRGTRLVMGNALVAQLAAAALALDVPLWLNADVKELEFERGRVVGALVSHEGRIVRVECSRGVVLATGGFAGSGEMQRQHYAHVRAGLRHRSLLPSTNDGAGLRLALGVGGAIDTRTRGAGAWTPVSELPLRDGSVTLFPHFGDRAKPGVIAVDSRGRRFANEAASYHDFGRAMLDVVERDGADEFALVTSHARLRRQGLGRVPPAPAPIGQYLRSGYLLRSDTVVGLAAVLGYEPTGFAETVRRFDHHARHGLDPDFARGASRFERAAGSADHGPNPCVAPLGSGPYYAIRILPGDIGNTRGLRVDANARVLDSAGAPIGGLYALGNCAASLMGSSYPAAGIMLGQALTFGYLAARHAGQLFPARLELH